MQVCFIPSFIEVHPLVHEHLCKDASDQVRSKSIEIVMKRSCLQIQPF